MKLPVKFAAMLVAAVLLFTAVAPLRVGNTARAEETIDSLREKIEALNQQQQEIKQELEYVQDESQKELKTLKALWQEISSLEEEIDVYRQIIEPVSYTHLDVYKTQNSLCLVLEGTPSFQSSLSSSCMNALTRSLIRP